MPSRTSIAQLLAVTLSAALAETAAAQCFNWGTAPLQMSFSTRGLAMGDANAASSDPDVIFYGPAQLAVAHGVSGGAARYDEYNLGSVAAVQHVGRGGFGIGATYAGAQRLPCWTDVLPYHLPDVSGHNFYAVGGAAFSVGAVHLGAALKLVDFKFGNGSTSRVAGDIGVSRAFANARQTTSLSLAVQNIGPRENDWSTYTPLRFVLGTWTSISAGSFNVAIASQLAYRRYHFTDHSQRDLVPAIGLELGHALGKRNRLAVRGGFRRTDEFIQDGNWTGGAGLTIHRLSIDYAFEDRGDFLDGAIHRFGIRVDTH